MGGGAHTQCVWQSEETVTELPPLSRVVLMTAQVLRLGAHPSLPGEPSHPHPDFISLSFLRLPLSVSLPFLDQASLDLTDPA